MRYGNHLLYLRLLVCLGCLFFAHALSANPSGNYTHPTKNASLYIMSIQESPDNEGYWRVKFEIYLNEPGSYMYLQASSGDKIPVSDTQQASGGPWSWIKEVDYKGGANYWITAEGEPNVAEGTFAAFPELAYYEASTGQFYNGSNSTVSYTVSWTVNDGTGSSTDTQQINLAPNEWFQANGGTSHAGSKLVVWQHVNGELVKLGTINATETGRYLEQNLPADYFGIVQDAGDQGEFEDYIPPVLPPDFSSITDSEVAGFPSALDEFPGFMEIDPELPQPGDTASELAEDNALNLEKLMKHDELLWEKSHRAQDSRFETLNQQQQARHDQSFEWQQKQLNESKTQTQAIEQQTLDIKGESNETQMQLENIDEKLETIEGNFASDEEKSEAQGNLEGTIPGGHGMSDVKGFSQSDADSAKSDLAEDINDAYGLGGFTPTVQYGQSGGNVDPYVFNILGWSFDFNPFDEGDWGLAAYFLREFVIWATALAVYFYSVKVLYDTMADLCKTPFKQANTELSIHVQPLGMGASLNLKAFFAFLGILAITGATLSSPAILTALASTRIEGISWSILSSNPLTGVPAPVEAGVNYVDQFLPVFHLVSVTVTYLVLESTRLPAFLAGYLLRQFTGII